MSQPSWIGYTLGGRYKIDQLLGQGGMSSVYRATDPNLRRIVAVKLIHSHLSSNPEFVRRFEEEAAAVAQLRHPNIIQVFDFNHDGDTYYMILEYIEGETLQDHLKRLRAQGRTMPVEDVVRIGAGLSDAIDYAHRRGMIHRDIKPANVMLDAQGQAILMDFGIAKIIGGEQHTATGAVVGTALYMSPEQVQGQRPSAQSDIYSLGVTLFEMVGGRPPFEADSAMSVMMMHVNEPVPDLAAINPQTPARLKAIIEQALAKDAGDRQASAGDVAKAMRAADMNAAPSGSIASTARVSKVQRPVQTPEETYIEAASTPPPPPRRPDTTPSSASYSIPPAAAQSSVGGYAPPPASAPRGKRGGAPFALIGGGVGLLLLLAVCTAAGVLLVLPRLTETADVPTNTPTSEIFEPTIGGQVIATEGNTGATATEDVAAVPTTQGPPTETATPADTATPTIPPGKQARITDITLDGETYVVSYETYEYTESNHDMHVHFFFNTVAPENAGYPKSGPWKVYGGPRPFRQYHTYDKPSAATQMCILVANADHSVIQDTGNCVDLPQ